MWKDERVAKLKEHARAVLSRRPVACTRDGVAAVYEHGGRRWATRGGPTIPPPPVAPSFLSDTLAASSAAGSTDTAERRDLLRAAGPSCARYEPTRPCFYCRLAVLVGATGLGSAPTMASPTSPSETWQRSQPGYVVRKATASMTVLTSTSAAAVDPFPAQGISFVPH
ncbi:hypothetical protein NUW54_g5381 [Trametes sanguinea]|uniref:Uncharacterized protein n=1 Tax=Trametes sanguinea TaxID=158606 RepID=A0ACC1PY04_9APHY|nr:hypothetical protein NUW54_g5381 [Trametes sanguinea]